MTRVGIVTQARMTSTRLPGKVLLEADGTSMLAHHVARLRRSGHPIYVATTTNVADDAIVDAATVLGVDGVTRGSEHDVLSRFAATARQHALDVVVRVTSDCPLIDGGLVRAGVDEFVALDDDRAYVTNAVVRTYPRGLDFEVFSAAALADADARAVAPAEREHVTPYLYAGTPPRGRLHVVARTADASRYRLTLDTEEDYVLLETLIARHGAAGLDAEELIALMDAHPELAAINAHVEQKKLGA